MALEATIGGNGELFVGEDKIIRLTVLDEAGIPVNTGSWVSVMFFVRKKDNSPDPAIFAKNTARLGVYDADPLVNTERWEVQLTDTELNTVRAKGYRHSWKRMDDGRETVLAWGDFAPQKATAP